MVVGWFGGSVVRWLGSLEWTRGKETESGRRRTEGRRQRAERRTEGGGQKAEGGAGDKVRR